MRRTKTTTIYWRTRPQLRPHPPIVHRQQQVPASHLRRFLSNMSLGHQASLSTGPQRIHHHGRLGKFAGLEGAGSSVSTVPSAESSPVASGITLRYISLALRTVHTIGADRKQIRTTYHHHHHHRQPPPGGECRTKDLFDVETSATWRLCDSDQRHRAGAVPASPEQTPDHS